MPPDARLVTHEHVGVGAGQSPMMIGKLGAVSRLGQGFRRLLGLTVLSPPGNVPVVMRPADRVRPWIALLVLGAHLWLVPFAFANPPDTLESGGVFDGGDYDDLVLVVMGMTGVVETGPVFEAPVSPVLDVEPVTEPPFPPTAPSRSRSIRAPPSA
jgi:hypothetical protein